jgi:uncharacterized protein GlcG (DUF336 family)
MMFKGHIFSDFALKCAGQPAPASGIEPGGSTFSYFDQSQRIRAPGREIMPETLETTGKALGVSLEAARKVIHAGEEKAREIGQPMNIAVVDAGANLVAFERMEGAWIGSIDISINKAFTARAFDIETKALGENSQSGDQFFGIHASNHGRVMIFAGGVPLKNGNQVVGAVGVSGGSGKQDQAVAEAAARAFGS